MRLGLVEGLAHSFHAILRNWNEIKMASMTVSGIGPSYYMFIFVCRLMKIIDGSCTYTS